MIWLLLYLFGKRRSTCTTPPAARADEPATTASSDHPEAAACTVPTVKTGDDVDTEAFGFFAKSTPAPPVDDAPSRQDIVDAIRFHNTTAKTLRRQGYTGIHGQSYRLIHGRIDNLLYDLAAMDLETSNGLA